ncbi:putative ribonuclease H-like domain-containing protein, partial [Tanacetum coccineum]
FQRGKIDKTLFIRRDKGDILLVQVYVDDIIFGSTKKSLCTEFEKMMHKKFQMSSMGELTFFLGLQVKQKKDGDFISQDKYVTGILKKFGFTDVKTASTPIETQKLLLKDEDGEEVDVYLYRSMIGSLMYLTSSRPNIMFAVCACARYQVNPKVSHLHVMKRIFRYLRGQPKLGLWYPKDSPFDLVAYTDSDYAGASLDKKSTTGGFQFLGSRLISWQCKKHTMITNSTTEAEYVATSSFCGQVLWIQNQLLDYGYNFLHTKILIDNNNTICIIKNPVFHSKTKHIEIRHHFIRDCNEKKLIQMVKIHTDKNVTDLLTKTFDNGIRVNAGDSKLMLLGINLLLLGKVNADRHKLTTAGEITFLAKPAESEGFEEIVDFLNAHTIKYALTVNPTIYTSCIEQFWATVKVKTVNGEVQLQALVDGKKIIVIEASIRSDLQLTDEEDEVVYEERDDSLERATTTATSLDVEQDRGNIDKTQSKATPNEPSSLGTSSGGGPRLENKGGSRTHKLKRLYKIGRSARVISSDEASLGDQEDASKQGKKIADIDADVEVTLIDETQGRNDDNLMFDTCVLDEQEVEVENVVNTAEVTTESATTTIVDELTLARTLIEIKAAKPKVRGVMIQVPSESTTTTSVASKPSQDKGKAKMIESEKPLKKKDQTMYDQEVALNLQAQLQAEMKEE